MRSRLIWVGSGTCAALLGGFVVSSRRSKVVSSADALIEPPKPSGQQWDYNWDRRAPESSVKPPAPGSNLEKYEIKLEEARPTAVRNLLLVRHGQYEQYTKEKWLTDLGREQAELVGDHLQRLNLPITKIVWSSKNRATETGKIISKYFEGVPTEACDLLREGLPLAAAEPLHPTWPLMEQERFTQGMQMEAGFRKHFHRAPSSQTEDSYEIISCHGNVIRYYVLRALQLPASAWINLSAYNASLTWLQIAPDGRVNLVLFGDTGFIPPHKITYWIGPGCPEWS
ncbi:serine/threonine-protein phosphatase PGAM5, mitochondrial-like isoform X2 [Watersipora subatra]